VALSKKFFWVKINRDHGGRPLCDRYHVSAYPSFLLLGTKDEKVFRFHGFKKPKEFLAQLSEGLRRYGLYRQGKEWDAPPERPETICDRGVLQTFPAPSEGTPSGLTVLDGVFWVAQGGRLYALSESGKPQREFALPAAVRDLCTDGKLLFCMEYGWTAGKPVHVIDPQTGKVVRTIVTEKNLANRSMGATGIAWKDGKLYVLAGMRGKIHELDPRSGEVSRVLETGARWLAGLDFDGRRFVAGGRKALHFLDGTTGKETRRVKMNYPLRVVAAHEGAYYLFEQAIFGYDKQHKRVRIFPKRVVVHVLRFP